VTARAALAAAVVVACACASPGAPPAGSALRDGRLAPLVPDAAEHAAADLAAAALVGDLAAADAAIARIRAFDAEREAGDTGLAPAAEDLFNAAARPGRAWRSAAEQLLERDDLDPALRERITRALRDDPLVRADARVRDARVSAFARGFNTLAEPIGQSLLSTALAPWRLVRSLASYGLHLYREDPLPLERRQALAHWKEFLARYPDAPESADVAKDVAKAEVRWHQTRRQHALREAEAALERDRPREALVLADRALHHSPEHAGSLRVRAQAEARLAALREAERRSVEFALPDGRELLPAGTREVAIALLARGPAPVGARREEAIADEARFAHAGWLAERGDEQAGFDALREIARGDPDTRSMVRHAEAELADPVRNPYDTFVRARWRDRRARALWVLIGPFAEAGPPRGAEGAVETLVELPRAIPVALTLPLRIVQLPWLPPPATASVTAVQAERYLRLAPAGVHAHEVSRWLQGYEEGRDNHLAALRLAEARDPGGDHADLREKAARQTLEVARREERSDLRHALLAGVARRFPGTQAGDEAGRLLRSERDELTPQRVAISRGFLAENPELAGVRGLDLDPALLDGDARNGELHPDGVALVGGRVLELSFVGASGDEDDPAETRREQVSRERLARLVARLEETSFRNALLDEGDPIQPDAQRDQWFERARLGLADDIDPRATSQASFTYQGMRDRYGLVRRREPLLPFDIVVQGSLTDLSLGAFPRMRAPEPPEDALLYE
jgi:hypothetical protein